MRERMKNSKTILNVDDTHGFMTSEKSLGRGFIIINMAT